MKELMIEVMSDDLVEFKAGKREAALLKAMNKSEYTKIWILNYTIIPFIYRNL